jgi:biopolymer transport protein ExbB
MRRMQSASVQRRATTSIGRTVGPLRLLTYAGVLCGLWLGQSRLLAQYAQPALPTSASGSYGAPAPLSNLPGAAGTLPGAQPTALPAAVNGAAPTEGSSTASAKIPMTSLLGAIREGGVMMLPIIGCSFALMVFVSERFLFLRRTRVMPRSFVRGVIEQLEQQQLDRDEAIALCEENGSPIAQLFQAALKRYGRPSVEIEQSVLDAGERVSNSLRSYLRMFSAISNITPLLGLLGTVLGMIEAFNAIAQTGAMGRPELLAGGIGQALLTTAAGLFVAIPAYTAYAFFLARADKLIIEMDTQVQRVIELVSAEGLQESGRSRSRSRRAAA